MKTLAALCLVALLGNTSSGPVPDEPIGNCSGKACTAAYTVFPLSGWSVMNSSSDGKGKGGPEAEDCDPCKDCDVYVTWVHTGGGN